MFTMSYVMVHCYRNVIIPLMTNNKRPLKVMLLVILLSLLSPFLVEG